VIQTPRGPWKCQAVESEENQKQVFIPFHSPWKSLGAIPTFPPPRLRLISINIKTERSQVYGRPSGSSFDENMLGRLRWLAKDAG